MEEPRAGAARPVTSGAAGRPSQPKHASTARLTSQQHHRNPGSADGSARALNRLFVGGTWSAPRGDDVVEVISPHTEEPYSTDPAAPFGGVKASGLGREGLEGYLDVKAISIAPPSAVR